MIAGVCALNDFDDIVPISLARAGEKYKCLKCNETLIVTSGPVMGKIFRHKVYNRCTYANRDIKATLQDIILDSITNDRCIIVKSTCVCCQEEKQTTYDIPLGMTVAKDYILSGYNTSADVVLLDSVGIKLIIQLESNYEIRFPHPFIVLKHDSIVKGYFHNIIPYRCTKCIINIVHRHSVNILLNTDKCQGLCYTESDGYWFRTKHDCECPLIVCDNCGACSPEYTYLGVDKPNRCIKCDN